MNVAVSTFYRKPGQDAFEIWEIIHEEKFTTDPAKAIHDGIEGLVSRVMSIQNEKRYGYFDEDKREASYQEFDGDIEIKVGDDYQKISVEEWQKEVGDWLNAQN